MLSYTPKTLEELPQALKSMTTDSKFVGGGTDYVIRLQSGAVKPDALCYLGYIHELKEIHWDGQELSIGAYATMTQIENHPEIRTCFPALMDAAGDVGSLQIRNNGTIGGNIANASPAGDLIPVLYLYHARIEVTGSEGTRMVTIDEVIAGPGRTTLKYDEAITRILLSKPDFLSSFVKLGFRKKVTIARIGIALGLKMDGDYVKELQFYAGAISLKPVRVAKAEEYLRGKPVNEEHIMETAHILSELIMEITPKEFDRDYKMFAARGIVLDAFKRLKRD